MAVYRDQKLWLDGIDATGNTNSLAVVARLNTNDITVLGNTNRVNGAGLYECSATAEGFYTASLDSLLTADFGVENVPFSFADSATAGSVAYTFKSLMSSYTPQSGSVGEELPFSLEAVCNTRLLRGTLMEAGTVTATGNGTGRQLGAVSSTQRLYAVLHVTAVSGTTPSMTVTVQRDDNSGFTTPATAVTFTAVNAVGSQWVEVAGPITDDYWRVNRTITGTGPSFTYAVILAIA